MKHGVSARVLWWLALTVFILSLVWIGVYYLQTSSQQRDIDELGKFLREAALFDAPAVAESDDVLEKYREVAQMNEHFIGWLSIDDTAIDVPVMHSPDEPQRYLRRDFQGEFSFSGLPFMDAICIVDDVPGNKIIYAHNMRNGTMFADLVKYLDEEYFLAHNKICFNTINSLGEYDVLAVFNLRELTRESPSMLCYRQIDTMDDEAVAELNDYINEFAAIRAEDATVLAGDQILTLSTCEHSSSLQRVIVMARRVPLDSDGDS